MKLDKEEFEPAATLYAQAGDEARETGDVGSTPARYTNQAEYLKQLERWEQALAASEKAIKADNAFWSGWAQRGNALFYLRRWDEAADSCQQALNRNPPAEDVAGIREGLTIMQQQIPADDAARAAKRAEVAERVRCARAEEGPPGAKGVGWRELREQAVASFDQQQYEHGGPRRSLRREGRRDRLDQLVCARWSLLAALPLLRRTRRWAAEAWARRRRDWRHWKSARMIESPSSSVLSSRALRIRTLRIICKTTPRKILESN